MLAMSGATGCDWPRDPRGTLDNVRGKTLRVGVMEDPPWVVMNGDVPCGPEVQLVGALSEELACRVDYRRGGESTLREMLEHGQLDLVIGGIADDSPWEQRVGLTRPFARRGDCWHRQQRVWAFPPGENGWGYCIDQCLHRRAAEFVRVPGWEALP